MRPGRPPRTAGPASKRNASAGLKVEAREGAIALKQHPKGHGAPRAEWCRAAHGQACHWGEPATGSGPRPLGAPAPTWLRGGDSPTAPRHSGNRVQTGTDQGPRCRPDGRWGGR
jgi:hypothetical protein